MTNLKSCPFCGGAAVYRRIEDSKSPNEGAEYVECSNRGCATTTKLMFPLKGPVEDILAELWNVRIEEPDDGK